MPVNIPQPTAAEKVSTTSIEAFQAVIDTAVASNKSLYSDRDALKAQILDLTLQLNELNAQIAASETDDVKKARTAIRVLDMISSGAQETVLRRFGIG